MSWRALARRILDGCSPVVNDERLLKPGSANTCNFFILVGQGGSPEDSCQLCANFPGKGTAGSPATIVHQMEGVCWCAYMCLYRESQLRLFSTRIRKEEMGRYDV